jgi:hypothetical protein
MKARLITVLVTLTTSAVAFAPVAEAAGRWG